MGLASLSARFAQTLVLDVRVPTRPKVIPGNVSVRPDVMTNWKVPL